MNKKIIGHGRVKEILQTSIENKRLSHAYLMYGIEGIGKRLLAQDFAYRLLGIGAKNTSEHIIRKVLEGNHPDIMFLGREEGSIKIEDVENLQAFLRMSPLESNYKIAFIDNAHLLTEQAQNRLLKTLEEPPYYVVLILITHKPSELLQTIHSRVERLSLSPLSIQQIESILACENRDSTSLSNEVVAGMAEGSALRAMEILKEPIYIHLRDFIIDWISDIMSGSALNVQRKLDRQEMDKDKAFIVILFLRLCLRDLLVIQQDAKAHSIMKDFTQRLQTLAEKVHSRQVISMLEAVETAEKSLERLVQPLLVLDVLSHTLQEVYRG